MDYLVEFLIRGPGGLALMVVIVCIIAGISYLKDSICLALHFTTPKDKGSDET